MALDDIAGYSLRRSLGAGSAGTVWLVRHLGSGRNAVLKRLQSASYPAIDRLRADLAMLQRLDHPHVARILEVRRSGNDWLIFSQHLVAGSLATLLDRRGPLTPGELVTLLNPLAEALLVLHHHGLTHGRVDAANVLFDADGRPVLTDTALHQYAASWQADQPRARATPPDDLAALSTLARQAGGDPTVFTPAYFTTTPNHLARRLLRLAAPEPIDLALTTPPTPNTDEVTPPPPGPPPTPSSTTHPAPQSPPRRPYDRLSSRPTTSDNPRSDTSDVPWSGTADDSRPDIPRPGTAADSTNGRPTTADLTNGRATTADPTNGRATTADPTNGRPTTADPTNGRPTTTDLTIRHPTTVTLTTSHPSSDPASRRATPTSSTPRSPTSKGATPTSATPRTFTPRSPAPRSAPPRSPASRSAPPRSAASRSAAPRGAAARGSASRAQRSAGLMTRLGTRHAGRFTSTRPAPLLALTGGAVTLLVVIGLVLLGILGPSTPDPAAAANHADPHPQPTHPQPTEPTSTREPATPTTQPATAHWLNLLQSLDAIRSQALQTLNPRNLDRIYLPNSPPWQADRTLLAAYRKQNVRIEGLRITINRLTVIESTSTTVTLRTTDHLTAGYLITPSGHRTPVPSARPTTRLITLTAPARSPTTWRISAITRA